MTNFVDLRSIAIKENKLYIANIELLTKCNWTCEHCYLDEHTYLGYKTSEVLDIINQIKALGAMEIAFTGGEIFLRKDILKIIEYARKKFLRVTLLTNASLLDEDIISKLALVRIKEVSTTIFSMQEGIHDSITKTKGSLNKTLNNIKKLKAAGIRVEIKTPILKKNYKVVEEIKEFAEINGFKFSTSLRITDTNNGVSLGNIKLNESQLNYAVKYLGNLKQQRNQESYGRNLACPEINYSISIDSFGNVFPCLSLRTKLGNIYEEPLKEIWNSALRNNIVGVKKNELYECISCELSEFCSRCPGAAQNIYSCSDIDKMIAKGRFMNFPGDYNN